MLEWIDHPHATFVLAAYGVAVALLLGLFFFSWRNWRCQRNAWEKTRQKNSAADDA